MKDGFIKVAAVTPKVRVADVSYNGDVIRKCMDQSSKAGAKIVVFPELCITGYTCQDLFLQETLLWKARKELVSIAEYSKVLDGIFFVGLPLEINGKLYNSAAAVSRGEILGIIPKSYLPNYNEFYELRHFRSGRNLDMTINLCQKTNIPVNTDLIFQCFDMPGVKIAAELCEDLWVPNPPSIRHALAGATIIVNLSASDEITGKSVYRRELVAGQSARLVCGYLYASAGNGESTQDVVYSGHNIIAENGQTLSESEMYSNEMIMSELDVKYLESERRRMNTFEIMENSSHHIIEFRLMVNETSLTRFIQPMPFVPGKKEERDVRCEEILMIQSQGLRKRLEHIGCKKAVIGISGGLDSALAFLVVGKAFDLLNIDHSNIIAVTMPGFGTTDRTYDNAAQMIHCLGAQLREISIEKAVNQHFRDIGQDCMKYDVTFENCQARERTQILMDISNMENGIVIGTGDLSELALGWATYNGDHMSMYGVNVSVPKTLVRHLVRYYADTCNNENLQRILRDILNTPVSPELLPTENGEIAQKTEDLVGPYELHDFFLYHMLRCGHNPKKIYRLAKIAYARKYENEVIKKWLRTFYYRFFSQHFKRSCLPDGPKVGSVSVSPRGDLRMPTDGCVRVWMDELDVNNHMV